MTLRLAAIGIMTTAWIASAATGLTGCAPNVVKPEGYPGQPNDPAGSKRPRPKTLNDAVITRERKFIANGLQALGFTKTAMS